MATEHRGERVSAHEATARLEALFVAATRARGGSKGELECHRCAPDSANGRLRPPALVAPAPGAPQPALTVSFAICDAGGDASFVWDPAAAEPALVEAASKALDALPPDVVHLALVCDGASGACETKTRTRQSLRDERDARLADALAEKRNRSRSAAPYGQALARAVAARLQTGASFGYSHRDYCGTGLQFQDGRFAYVELWDGHGEPLETFASAPEFIAWLSRQSDRTLARTEQDDDWFWDNQVIDQRRLLEFIERAPPIP